MNAEQQLQHLLLQSSVEATSTELPKFRDWFLGQFRQAKACNVEDFAIYFLHTLRQCTEQHLRANESASETSKTQTPVSKSVLKLANTSATSHTPKRLLLTKSSSTTTTTTTTTLFENANASVISDSSCLVESQQHNSCQSDRLDYNTSADSWLNTSYSAQVSSNCSTPIRRTTNQHSAGRRARKNTSAITSTPQNISKERSSSSGICFGDFLINSPTQRHNNNNNNSSSNGCNNNHNSNKKKKKATPQHSTAAPYSRGVGHGGSASSPCHGGSKPKKRVVPTTISKSAATPFGGTYSAFGNENNLLRLSENTEIVDPSQCAVLEARKLLKLNASEISRELETSQKANESLPELNQLIAYAPPSPVDLTKVTQQPTLKLLASIYAQLIEQNLVPNVLSELAYVLQLLNVPDHNRSLEQCPTTNTTNTTTTTSNSSSSSKVEDLTLLNDFANCIYFACEVLDAQKQLLLQLDAKSLGVVLNNERIELLPQPLHAVLQQVYQARQKVGGEESQQNIKGGISNVNNLGFKNVYYQHDKDTREHFPTNVEFGAFKTQRDLFYKTYKEWESMHLNPNFNFKKELASKVREIFRRSEHVVNMAHFAKLFVAQLLFSACEASISPQDLGIEMDVQKFSKLTQRLFAPSNFSVDYQFPRSQAFFRDFIAESGSMAFLMQLKLALYAQLIEFNDSSYEQLELHESNFGGNTFDLDAAQLDVQSAYIVRPAVLASLLILAKFLGYVSALPYVSDGGGGEAGEQGLLSQQIAQQQLRLRGQFQPDFNVCSLLDAAFRAGKLLITLPWLVQYLAMLDSITLQLASNTSTLHLLFELYRCLGTKACESMALLPTAVFIIRCCIGWLLETKTNIALQYYDYRVAQGQRPPKQLSADVEELVSASVTRYRSREGSNEHTNRTLEQLLNVACPFLPEFRVSIMPAKYASAKWVSRTGRYRHITTRFAGLTTPATEAASEATAASGISSSNEIATNDDQPKITAADEAQNKLTEAFLHSQHASVRRLIEFVTERTYKSVVKDAQHEIILPSKAAADNKVNELTSSNGAQVLKAVQQIYGDARQQACEQWETVVPGWIDKRVRQSLDTLLPRATNETIRITYRQLIKRNARQRTQQWLQSNVLQANFYCKDLGDMTQKICKANSAAQQQHVSSELVIVPDGPSVSDILDELKQWLHVSSMRPELIGSASELQSFLSRISGTFVHTLPTVFYTLVGAGLLQLCQQLISRHTDLLTPMAIDYVCRIWSTPVLQELAVAAGDKSAIPSIFEPLITVAFIQSLGTNRVAFEQLRQLLVAMVRSGIVSLDYLNKLFVPLFKENWIMTVWAELSGLLSHIAKDAHAGETHENARADCSTNDPEDEAKSQLFMEVLADFSRDLDF